MTGTGELRVEGARQLRSTLRRAGDQLEDLRDTHAAAAALVAAAGTAAAPRRTGRLAGTVRGSGTKTHATVRAGYARVPYANPIHWGWPRRNIRPSLFLTTAAAQTEPTWVELYTREVNRILDQVEGVSGGIA